MKRMKLMVTLAFILAVCSLTGCENVGSASKNDGNKSTAASALTTSSVSSESISTAFTDETEEVQPTLSDQTEADQSAETAGQNEIRSDAITEEQALNAVRNYCFIKNPDLKDMVNSGEYNIYWDVAANSANEIVVLYRSYTAAQMRYYIDTVSGETYVTELVPGIIDEEQRTEESFNIRDYFS